MAVLLLTYLLRGGPPASCSFSPPPLTFSLFLKKAKQPYSPQVFHFLVILRVAVSQQRTLGRNMALVLWT